MKKLEFAYQTIAKLEDKIKDTETQHSQELANYNSYAAVDMENRHDKAMTYLIDRLTGQRNMATEMMGELATPAVVAYNYAISIIKGINLDDF